MPQIKCQIYRQKGILNPEYKFFLENLDGNLLLLMTARKKKRSKTTCYVISSIEFDMDDLEKYTETPLAKLKSNLLGTNFSLYDFGPKPPRAQQLPAASLSSNKLNSSISNNNSTSASSRPISPIATATNCSSTASLPKSEAPSTCTTTQKSIDQCSDTNTSDESSPSFTTTTASTTTYRKEYVSVSYEMNVLGVKGPRQMSVIVPGMDVRQSREDFVQHASNDTLSQAWKKILANMKSSSSTTAAVASSPNSTESNVSPTLLSNQQQQHSQAVATSPKASSKKTTSSSFSSSNSSSSSKLSSLKRSLFHLNRTQSVEKQNEQTTQQQQQRNSKGEIQQQPQQQQQMRNVVKLVNKSPEWHKGLSSFALDFHGRVTMASVKNFQIVHEANPDYVVMQFGKVNKDLYTCDYSYPFCALQAFALAITSLDNKLGCD